MDSQVLNILALTVSFFLFMVVALKIGTNLKKSESSPNIPPGPWKLPIIGNIPHLVTSTPHQKLRELAKIYGPLMHLQLGELFAIIVSSPEYAKEIMKTHDVIFASRPRNLASDIISYESTNIVSAPYGNYWRQLRKICTVELLTHKRVNSFKPMREEELTNLVKMIDSHKGSPFNLTEAVLLSIYNIIARAAFGMKCKDQEEFISLIKEGKTIATGFHIGDFFPSVKWFQLVSGLKPKLETLHQHFDRILGRIINEHIEAKSKSSDGQGEAEEDLVDVLLKYQDGNERNQDICLTINNIKAIILDIFGAGGETAATTINWAMAEMIRDPRVLKKTQTEVREVFNMKGRVDEACMDELKYLKSVVKETLKTCEIKGYHIPAKSKVIVNAWAIGRDPKYWTEAERFHPERFIDSSIDYKGINFEYIPFGAGRRICPGITFGLVNVELALAFLLYHFDWKLPNGMKNEDLDMTEKFGITVSNVERGLNFGTQNNEQFIKTEPSPNLPPGPWKLPIIGNIHNLVSSSLHRKLRDLATIYGPLMHLQLGEVFTIIVSSPQYAKEIMKTHDLIFASRPKILASDIMAYESTDIIFSPYGKYWRQLRKICTLELFTHKRVNSFHPIREEELTNLVKMIDSHKGSPFNLTEALLSSVYNIISRAAFGMKCEDQEKFISVVNEAITVGSGLNIGDLFPSAKWLQHFSGLRPKVERLHQQIDRILEGIISEHREAKLKAKEGHGDLGEDLVDVLLKFQDGNDTNQDIYLTNNNIKAIILDIFAAGGESSPTTINWAMTEIIRDPRVMKKAQDEVREVFNMKGRVDGASITELIYLKSIVKETLRRICPGITFGLASVELTLASLLFHFDWKLPNGMKNEDLDLTEQFGATVRRKEDLYLIPLTSHPLLFPMLLSSVTMDCQILNILALIISFFLFMILALKIRTNLNKTDSSPNMPPAPWKLPIVGNIHNLVTSTPHRKLRDLATIYGPLMHLQLGEVFAIIVSSPEYAMEIMKTHDVIFASRPKIMASDILAYESTNIVFASYGNYWRQLRKICTVELFTQKRVSSFQPIREEELTNLVKMIDSHKGSPFNLTEALLSSVYNIISRSAFGMKCKDREEFILMVKEAVKIGSGLNVGDLFPSAKWLQLATGLRPKLERLRRQSDRILEDIITEHKEAKSKGRGGQGEAEEDLVDVLLKFQDGNDSKQDICLTIDNIKAIILDIFGAGGETSTTTINWAMAEMIRDPRVMKKAQDEVREVFNMKGRVDETCMDELKYLKLVVKETLRLHPPAPLLIPRESAEACEINGYHIPVKSKVIVNACTIGRDPNYWTEAERFYPERFIDSSIDYKKNNFEYIPFGAGRRICPGMTLGLMNVELALAFLLYHFDWKLPNGMKNEDLDMTEQFGVTVGRKDDLYLIPVTSPPFLS
ncbi:unnamed protein product [Sphenostylis stenocarpa]|uniref:Cytochrome P450 n=1 Tax=Sphenostylis stenocarpa TaxID=92480 RepID=A0AA86VEY3_9FABA|nr:unnamed protein product [Sphenostylis stenocarpa]